jgi:hypothetical protein
MHAKMDQNRTFSSVHSVCTQYTVCVQTHRNFEYSVYNFTQCVQLYTVCVQIYRIVRQIDSGASKFLSSMYDDHSRERTIVAHSRRKLDSMNIAIAVS